MGSVTDHTSESPEEVENDKNMNLKTEIKDCKHIASFKGDEAPIHISNNDIIESKAEISEDSSKMRTVSVGKEKGAESIEISLTKKMDTTVSLGEKRTGSVTFQELNETEGKNVTDGTFKIPALVFFQSATLVGSNIQTMQKILHTLYLDKPKVMFVKCNEIFQKK